MEVRRLSTCTITPSPSHPCVRKWTQIHFYLENEALNNIICALHTSRCRKTQNRLASLMDTLTSGIRRYCDMRINQDLTEICMSLLPFHSINFVFSSYAPLDRPRVFRVQGQATTRTRSPSRCSICSRSVTWAQTNICYCV